MSARAFRLAAAAVALACVAAPLDARAQSMGSLAWCSGRAAVASVQRGAVLVVDPDPFSVQTLPVPFSGDVSRRREVVWSPSCDSVAVVDSDRIAVVDVGGGGRRDLALPAGLDLVFTYGGADGQPSVAWSPSGRSLLAHLRADLSAGARRALVRFDAATGGASELAWPADAHPMPFAALDDTTALAGVSAGGPLRLLRVDAQSATPLSLGRRPTQLWIQPAPLTVVVERYRGAGASSFHRLDPATGGLREFARGLYRGHHLSADGSTLVVDDQLMHLARPEDTRLWALPTVTGGRRRRYRVNPNHTAGLPSWSFDARARSVVGLAHPTDRRFGTHPVSYRQPHHTHFVVDGRGGVPALVFQMGTRGDEGPWVEEQGVSPDGRWALFVVTRRSSDVPRCPEGQIGARSIRSLVRVDLRTRGRETADLDVVAVCTEPRWDL